MDQPTRTHRPEEKELPGAFTSAAIERRAPVRNPTGRNSCARQSGKRAQTIVESVCGKIAGRTEALRVLVPQC